MNNLGVETPKYSVNRDGSVKIKETSLFSKLAILCRNEIKKVLNIDMYSARPSEIEFVIARFSNNTNVDFNGVAIDGLEGMDHAVISVKYCIPVSAVEDIIARRFNKKYRIIESMIYTKSQVERIFGCSNDKKRMIRLTAEVEGLYEKIGRFLTISGKHILDNIEFFEFVNASKTGKGVSWVRYSYITKLIGKTYAVRASRGDTIIGVDINTRINKHGEKRYRKIDIALIKRRINSTIPMTDIECWKGVCTRVKQRVIDRLKLDKYDERRINKCDIDRVVITTALALREEDGSLVRLNTLDGAKELKGTKKIGRMAIIRKSIPTIKIGQWHYVAPEYVDVCNSFYRRAGREYSSIPVFKEMVTSIGLPVL